MASFLNKNSKFVFPRKTDEKYLRYTSVEFWRFQAEVFTRSCVEEPDSTLILFLPKMMVKGDFKNTRLDEVED